MSRIISQEHAERITRAAAQAIGLEVPDTAKWSPALGGLIFNPLRTLLGDGSDYADNCFCPLNEPEHAYMIESKLQINVFHKRLGDSYVISLRSSTDGQHGALVYTVNKGDDGMRVRMEAVTQFAALEVLIAAEV